MSHFKLGVEVTSAHDLLPKDGQGASNAYVEIHFDGQKNKTTIKENDLNPVWNETFYFNISNPNKLHELTLDAHVYHHSKPTNKKTCIGKVTLNGTSFVPFSDAVLLHYPLEKPSILTRSRGELGLKVFLTSDPYITASSPLPAMNTNMAGDPRAAQAAAMDGMSDIFSSSNKSDMRQRRTFHHLPKDSNSKQPQMVVPPPPSQPMEDPPRTNYGAYEMRARPPQPPRPLYSGQPSMMQPPDYSLKETSPVLGGGRVVGGRVIPDIRPASTYDLVEKMEYLFVRVVKARNLPSMDVTGSIDPYAEVRLGNYRGRTKYFAKNKNPEWNQVFAFAKDEQQATELEVVVLDKDLVVNDIVGRVRFDLHEVPTRIPPDSPLAPEWYSLEDENQEKKKWEIMLAVWYGTQADEAFPDAWQSDAAVVDDPSSSYQAHIRSKVYHSPRLWYLRVNVIEAQELLVSEKNRSPNVYVKVQIGSQVDRTKIVQAPNKNPIWNEELMLVAAEPFEEHLTLTVMDHLAPNKDEPLGKVVLRIADVTRRVDDKNIQSRWHGMERSTSAAMDPENLKKDKFFSRLHLEVCLEGGYHVFDESTYYSSDLRPTSKQLWKDAVGILEVGILNADGLHPMKTRDGRGVSDTYCVAKYGHKWVRTRTIINNLNPKYNEQYTWEVYDPATVLTVGVFDNSQIGGGQNNGSSKDMEIGKVRIRISTLETGRVYTHSYPLLVLHPSGVKKMGELHLAIRFSCTSMLNMMYLYSRPLLPKMHYVRPLSVIQQDRLRHHALKIVVSRLTRAEPPLKAEVIEYISDMHSHLWSMRRSKANFSRLTSVFSGLLGTGKWFGDVCQWKNPVTTVLVHILFLMLIFFPELILPTAFLYMFVIGVWNYYYRPRYPPHMNTRISHADVATPDELDEEFDSFPSTKSPDIVRMRYDKMRVIARRIQSVVGDIASQGERVQALLSWRDTRASAIFMVFCLVAAVVLYITPFQLLALLAGFYVMRHPRFRRKLPSRPFNFFKRLPTRADSML
ncbi:hypothetical protein SAY86_027111 [Trapa natans]|uniref:C2 domain-containing protein n=1 Tax=Trapa natans TaxID=22666 RepID=A0AAN7QIU1_TRANT|nr:hypothetical protein SAY86_027111 [Trapa natans]